MAFENTRRPVRVPNMVASILFGINLARVIWVGMACITAYRAVVVSSVRQRYRNMFFGLAHPLASKNWANAPAKLKTSEMERAVLNSRCLHLAEYMIKKRAPQNMATRARYEIWA